MPFDQYHEPPSELPQEVRTFARMIVSLIEEAEAIDWYEQRLAVERDSAAKEIMEDAQGEEFKHFAMDLEFLIRHKPKWRIVLRDVLFTEGSIVQLGKRGEQDEESLDAGGSGSSAGPAASSSGRSSASGGAGGNLRIGSLKGVSQHE